MRRSASLLAAAIALALPACAPTSELVEEVATLTEDLAARIASPATPEGPLRVVSISPDRAVIDADGQPVVILPSDGYCLQTDRVETGTAAVFMLAENCAPHRPETARHLLTASVSGVPLIPRGEDPALALGRLERFLRSSSGSALLALSETAGEVTVDQALQEDRALLLQLEEAQPEADPASAPSYARAFLDVNGRMVSLSASSLAQHPEGDEANLTLLRAFIAQLRLANPGETATAAPAG